MARRRSCASSLGGCSPLLSANPSSVFLCMRRRAAGVCHCLSAEGTCLCKSIRLSERFYSRFYQSRSHSALKHCTRCGRHGMRINERCPLSASKLVTGIFFCSCTFSIWQGFSGPQAVEFLKRVSKENFRRLSYDRKCQRTCRRRRAEHRYPGAEAARWRGIVSICRF